MQRKPNAIFTDLFALEDKSSIKCKLVDNTRNSKIYL